MLNIWKLRNIGRISILRKLIKYLFSLIFYDGRIIEIKRGPLTGIRWYCNKNHQFWMPLGLYEKETSDWLASQIKPGMTFFDIGGNAGYFTLLASKLVGPNGAVISFEPVPINIETIHHQLNVNAINNTKVEPIAISEKDATIEFTIEANNANSHISNIEILHAPQKTAKVLKVKATCLDNYISEYNVKPDFIKMDVEGAEFMALKGAENLLTHIRPIFIISTHGTSLHSSCIRILENSNYHVQNLDNFEHEIIAFPK